MQRDLSGEPRLGLESGDHAPRRRGGRRRDPSGEPDGQRPQPDRRAPRTSARPSRAACVTWASSVVVARPLFAGSLDRSGSFSQRPNSLDGAVAFVQYAKPRRNLQSTLGRLHLFLALGVLGGTGLAFLAGFAVARRAMRPIAGLTQAAQEVARTRDPAISLPKPRGQGRGGEAGRHARGHAARAGRRALGDRGRAGPPARVRGRRLPRAAHAAHEHPRQPRAARGGAHPEPAGPAIPRPPPRSRARRCAPRTGCAGWWATCCCSPAPTPAGGLRGSPSTSPPWSARRRSRRGRWRRGTT